jgi:hypothetical protein
LRWRAGYSPFFRHVATSALLAALLVKFSVAIAPGWRIQMSSWVVTLLYLYFAVARASFIRTHCLVSGKPLDGPNLFRGEIAFSIALQRHRRDLAAVACCLLVLGAAADILAADLSMNARNKIGNAIVGLGIAGWLCWCPRFLVASGVWAIDGQFSLRRSYALARRAPWRLRKGWLVAVVVNAAVSLGAMNILYPPLRSMVIAVLPSGNAVYLFGAAFLACLIAFQLTLQAAFAAWIAPDLLRVEGASAPSVPEPRASDMVVAQPAQLSRQALRRLFILGGLLLPVFAYLVANLVTAGQMATPSMFLTIGTGPSALGLAIWAAVVTLVELPVAAITTRAAPRAGHYIRSGMRAGALVPVISAVLWILMKGGTAQPSIIGAWCGIAGIVAGAVTGYLYCWLARRFVLPLAAG